MVVGCRNATAVKVLSVGPGGRINLDPVTSNLGAYFATMPVEYDQIGLLLRHMTVHAMAGDWLARCGMTFELVATQTIRGEVHQVFLWEVNIVAGQTGHC